MKCSTCGIHDYHWNIGAHQAATGHAGIEPSNPDYLLGRTGFPDLPDRNLGGGAK